MRDSDRSVDECHTGVDFYPTFLLKDKLKFGVGLSMLKGQVFKCLPLLNFMCWHFSHNGVFVFVFLEFPICLSQSSFVLENFNKFLSVAADLVENPVYLAHIAFEVFVS